MIQNNTDQDVIRRVVRNGWEGKEIEDFYPSPCNKQKRLKKKKRPGDLNTHTNYWKDASHCITCLCSSGPVPHPESSTAT
jgi:hypothetical protein